MRRCFLLIYSYMKIAVGTLSEQKLGYFSEILDKMNIIAEVLAVEAASGVSDQPVTSGETKRGSINRARTALESHPEADAAIGIEVGYHPNKDGDYKIMCWVTLVDFAGREVSVRSHKLLLPQFHQRILKADQNLGDFVRQYINDVNDQSMKELGEIIRSREPFIKTALQLALWEWLMTNA